MNWIRALVLSAVAALGLSIDARAGSTINPAQPAANSPLASGPVRNNFLAAFNDVNNILGMYAGASPPPQPTNLQSWADTSASPLYVFKYRNNTTTSWVAYGTLNINTGVYTPVFSSAGFLATPPLTVSVMAGVVTYGLAIGSNFQVSANQLHLANSASGYITANCTGGVAEAVPCSWTTYADTAISNVNGSVPSRVGGIWTTISTGTTGHVIPFTDGVNLWSGAQTIYLGASVLPAALTGTVQRLSSADGVNTVNEADAFGAHGDFACVRANNTVVSRTTLVNADVICSFSAFGYDGTGTSAAAAYVRMYAAGTWTNVSHPTYARIATTPSGSTVPVDRMSIESDGSSLFPPAVTGGGQGAGTINASGLFINGVPTLVGNVPQLFTNVAAPSTPGAGFTYIYADVTNKVLSAKDDAGTVSSTVVPSVAVANQFVTGISAAGVITRAQPAFSDISGQATLAQLPSIGTLTALCNVTGGSAVPTACSKTQLTTLVNTFTAALSGAVAPPITAVGNFLRDDNTWQAVGGTGTVTSIVCDGVTITITGTCPPRHGYVNCTLSGTAAASALTIALKDAAGNDPSAASPCTLWFRNVTAITGSWTQIVVTSAQSLVISSGSTLGVTSSTGFRIWVVAINDGGTFRLGAGNMSVVTATGATITPLYSGNPITTNAEGGAGGADSAGIVYTGTSVTAKSFLVLGYLEWAAAGLTAGTWTTTNLASIQSMSPGIPLPGQTTGGVAQGGTTSATVNNTATFATAMSAPLVLSSAANLVRINISGTIINTVDVANQCDVRIARGSTSVLVNSTYPPSGAAAVLQIGMSVMDKPNAAGTTTYNAQVRANAGSGGNCTFPYNNGTSSPTYGTIIVEEIQG
jgi:hypothetical protein